jgi:hypothetical protein
MKHIYVRILMTLALASILSACGGGGGGGSNGSDIGGAGNQPPPAPAPPTDPTTTAEWAALVTRLDIKFTGDRDSVIAEQSADNGPLDGNYYARARDRLIDHVDSFWDYSYDQTLSWSNSSSVRFEQADVAALLDDYRLQWLSFIDYFVDDLPGNPGGNVLSTIRSDMRSATNDGYNNTMRLLEAWLVQSIAPASISKVEGSWTTDLSNLTITIQPNGRILGYDYLGCKYEGVLVPSRWVGSEYRVIMEQECGTVATLFSGSSLFTVRDNRPLLLLRASSTEFTIDIILDR